MGADAVKIAGLVGRRIRCYGRNVSSLLRLSRLSRTLLYHLYYFRVTGRRVHGLHLGSGNLRVDQFWNIDVDPLASCDVIASVERIKLVSESVDLIYASHVLEHIPRCDAKAALCEWYRVLSPGGKLYLCVPDIEALFKIYLQFLPLYDTEDGQFRVDLACGVTFGGQTNKYDFHYSGYSMTTLKALLLSVGFSHVQRFDPRRLEFAPRDASYAEIRGELVSLNIEATR